jgi:plastocyanin
VAQGTAIGRGVWAVIVAAFVVVAVAVPVKLVDRHRKSGATSRVTAGSAIVHMAGLQFAPGHLVVKKGTNVVFDNNDLAPHTVTEDTAIGVESGLLSPGKSFSLVVDRTLVYHCSIHPFMKDRVDLSG